MRAAVSEGLDSAVTKALAPLPADRFASAAEFARALRPGPTAETIRGLRARAPPPVGRSDAECRWWRRRWQSGFSSGSACCSPGGEVTGKRRTGGAKVLAVLPFENLGDSSQAYFADGVGDEVRGKLSQLAGLAVIARASSNEYRTHDQGPAADRSRVGGSSIC